MKKVADFLSQARAIWLGMLCFVGFAVWAADTRYVKISDAKAMVEQIKIDAKHTSIQRQINRLLDENANMEIEKLYSERPNDRNRIDALIEKNRGRIEQLRHEDKMLERPNI